MGKSKGGLGRDFYSLLDDNSFESKGPVTKLALKDIQAVFVSTCAHRLLLSAEADAKGMRAEELLESILKSTPAPRI